MPCDIFALVDEFTKCLPLEFRNNDKLKVWLTSYTETVIDRTSRDFSKAAESGIERTCKLMLDPKYHETSKKRRAARKLLRAQRKVRGEQERLMEETLPPGVKAARELKQSETQLEYHKNACLQIQSRMVELRQTILAHHGIKQVSKVMN